MGSLRAFDLSKYVSEYNINCIIETGTFLGDGVEYALEFAEIDRVFSFEINEILFEKSLSRFRKNDRVELIFGNSAEELPKLLNRDSLRNCNGLFFLDAHFPGADARLSDYDTEKNEDINIPLRKELIALSKRVCNNDVIIIDDLRLFEYCDGVKDVDAHFIDIGKSHITKRQLVHFDLMELIGEYLPNCRITRIYKDEGYMVLLPPLADRLG